jgi:hypothetical protein
MIVTSMCHALLEDLIGQNAHLGQRNRGRTGLRLRLGPDDGTKNRSEVVREPCRLVSGRRPPEVIYSSTKATN